MTCGPVVEVRPSHVPGQLEVGGARPTRTMLALDSDGLLVGVVLFGDGVKRSFTVDTRRRNINTTIRLFFTVTNGILLEFTVPKNTKSILTNSFTTRPIKVFNKIQLY